MSLRGSNAMRADTKLQILQPVVRTIAILVMDRLVTLQRTTKMLLHHIAMLKNPAAIIAGTVVGTLRWRELKHYVAV